MRISVRTLVIPGETIGSSQILTSISPTPCALPALQLPGLDPENQLDLTPANAARAINEVWDYLAKRAPPPLCDELTEFTADHYHSLLVQAFAVSGETLRPVVHVFRQGDDATHHLPIPACDTSSLTGTASSSFLHPDIRVSLASGHYELALRVDHNYGCESRSGELVLTLETQTDQQFSERIDVIQAGDSQACDIISGSNLESIEVTRHYYNILSAAIFSETSHITSLIWGNNKTTEITADVFSNSFPNLTSLHMGGNPIETLPSGIFSGLEELTQLRFEGNENFRFLLSGPFSGLSSLVELSLARNRIKQIESSAFSDLNNLISLPLKRQ